MDFARTTPLPRPALSHSHNFMTGLLARCKTKSIAPCEFDLFATCYPIDCMKTIGATRHTNLMILIERFGTLAALNDALGLVRTDATPRAKPLA